MLVEGVDSYMKVSVLEVEGNKPVSRSKHGIMGASITILMCCERTQVFSFLRSRIGIHPLGD